MDLSDEDAVSRIGEEPGVTAAECRALRILYQDGWSIDSILMCFEIGETAAWKHINQECSHSPPASD